MYIYIYIYTSIFAKNLKLYKIKKKISFEGLINVMTYIIKSISFPLLLKCIAITFIVFVLLVNYLCNLALILSIIEYY